MSVRNLLLCRLLGDATAAAVPLPPDAVSSTDGDGLLAAMDAVRVGDVRRFAALADSVADDEVAALSRYCLYLGLAGEPFKLFLFFDALRRRTPLHAEYWLDLAVLQIAADALDAALRSIAMHAALTGRDGLGDEPTVPQPAPEFRPGRINILKGDSLSFVRA